MAEILKHWREGGKLTHCGVEMLPNGEDIKYIVIDNIQFVYGENVGGTKKDGFVAEFKTNEFTSMKMWLNSTNKKRLALLAGTDYLEQVKNFPVRLTKELTNDPSDRGSKIWGLRVSKIKALAPKKPNFPQEKLKGAIEALKAKTTTIDQIKERYTLTKTQEDELNGIK